MSKILQVEELGNFEVMQWMQDTKKRHAREDAEAESQGLALKPRPANLKKAFNKHERHLKRDIYPYEKNKSVHNENFDVDEVCGKFNDAVLKRIHIPIRNKYSAMVKAKKISKAEGEDKYEEETDPKILTEFELLQIHNLAPKTLETLQLCVEQHEERFTESEMCLILDAVKEILRPDEKYAVPTPSAEEKVVEDGAAATDAGAETTGLGETAKMTDALREVSPYTARGGMSVGPVIDQAAPIEGELALRPAPQGPGPAGWAVNAQRSGSNV